MKRLPRNQVQKAVRMCLNGASVAEIAHSIGVSIKSATSALGREICSDEPENVVEVNGYRLSPDAAIRYWEVHNRRQQTAGAALNDY